MYTLKDYNNREWLFDKHFDDTTPKIERTVTQSRAQVETFGKYPMVYYAGSTNFFTYTISTVFIGENGQTPLQQYNDFLEVLAQRKAFRIADGFGRTILADVSLLSTSESKLVAENYHNYIEVVVNVVEIGEV